MLSRGYTVDFCCDFRSNFLILKDVKEYIAQKFSMRRHKARTFLTDPFFFIAQKKKSHVKSQQKIARVDSVLR